ncbi:MAG: CpaD family pilus assembly lipoprotein [Stellaceae bacterium]
MRPSPSRLCLALFLLVAGCTPSTSEWTPAEAPKTPHVDYVRLQHEAAFKPGSPDLAGGEASSLASFLTHAGVTSEDHVYFEAASDDHLTLSRIGRLTKVVDQQGVGARTLPPAEGLAPDRILVVVERYVVTPPNCPNWTAPAVGDHGNQPGSNFGCADATNFSLMVADPRDLVIGRTLDPAQGDAAFAAVSRYRLGKVKDPSGQGASTTYGQQQSSGGGGAGGGGSGDSGQ